MATRRENTLGQGTVGTTCRQYPHRAESVGIPPTGGNHRPAPWNGMGFYLADDAREMVNRHRRQQFFDETLPTLVSEMKILGITPDELLSHLKQ